MENLTRNLILSTLSTLAFLIHPPSLSAQNSFSLSVDVDGSVGDQAVTSLNVSADQVVAIQIFGKDIQNANGLAVRFEYDASQVTYDGFDAGDVLPNAQALPEQEHKSDFCRDRHCVFGRSSHCQQRSGRHSSLSSNSRIFRHSNTVGARRTQSRRTL